MAEDLGSGVTRTLSASGRQFQIIVWQAGKPPLDSELNLVMQADLERAANMVRSQMPSGFLLDPFKADADFVADPSWSNFFKLGNQGEDAAAPFMWANVNGWIVPVTGTGVENGDLSNRINLYPPPSSDARIDFVFLEVFLAQVAPNPSESNKPSAATLWKYGNVKFGGTNISDDLEDPTIGFETTERVQLQYRLRVVGQGTGLGDSIDLSTFPDGLDDPNVLAQGTADDPQSGFTWENMRETLGDPGLWRSGDGDATNELGTIDGYSYAIPVCGVFRRNSGSFVARTNGGNANQNGAIDRNPVSVSVDDPVEGTRIFGTVTLTSAISATDTGDVQVTGLADSGLDNGDIDWTSTFITIGGEVIGLDSVDSGTGVITIRASGGRGRFATQALLHEAGAEIKFFNFRADGLFSDQIAERDILDLRRAVAAGDWDYKALLAHNLGKLFENTLRSVYKQAAGSDTQGASIIEVDTLWANGATAVANQTTALDGPDGIRTVFSDSSAIERTSLILKPTTSSPGSLVSVSDYTAGSGSWDSAPDFVPSGFQRNGGGWADQTIIRLSIGGASTNDGARATVRTAQNRIVRFVSPREYWLNRDQIGTTAGIGVDGNQTPFKLRFIEEAWSEPTGTDESGAAHPGPMFPLPEHNFERPFIVLGGIVNSNLRETAVETFAAGSSPTGLSRVRFGSVNFDTAGAWTSATDPTSLSTDGITNLLLHGSRNLRDMLTAGGTDTSGSSSELYLVLSGDTTNSANLGVFRVVGAGTIGYTTISGASGADLVVERVGTGAAALVSTTGLTAEVRSQYTHTMDGDSAGEGASAVIVLTDLESVAGGESSPWDGLITTPSESQAVLETTLLYGPSRGGTARVADVLDRVAMVGINTAEMVREAPTGLDPDFDDEAGVPEGELYFPLNHAQTWNHLPSLGLSAPLAPEYGEVPYLGEARREAEVFVDAGSKTLVIRPFRRVDLTLNRFLAASGRYFPETYTDGVSIGQTVDGGAIFPADGDYAYAFPYEYMPRFGRQDIPYHQKTGTTQTVYPGINHLFGDSTTNGDDVFRVLGGVDSTSTVVPLYFQTGTTSGRVYGEFFSMGGSAEGYQARVYEDVNVISSDLPPGLKGIQLPPFLGVGRLFGVYDLREFAGLGAWNGDRVTLSAAPGRPKNLLRTDADKQTLFIVKGGAEDVTGNEDDHTYVVPSNVIDVTLSGEYIAGETFDDLEFVVECEVFGFGRGFINKNNYILARKNLPTTAGTGNDGTEVDALAANLSCILPLPLPYDEQLYVLYRRTPYQGDPYMTRDGSTKTTSDYTARYGQIPQASAILLGTAIQQFDSTDDYSQVPQIPNARALEVLASADFYTTLGTGRVGGRMYPGTFLDVGHLTNSGTAPSRIPEDADAALWQPEVRTFTQPVGPDAARATLTLIVRANTTTASGESVSFVRGSVTEALVADSDFFGGSISQTAEALADAINANVVIRNVMGVQAVWDGGTTLQIISYVAGEAGAETQVKLVPASGSRFVAGFSLVPQNGLSSFNRTVTASNLVVQPDPAMNAMVGSRASASPIRMAGLIERLPLGILLQDSDFLGEDPMRDGTSALRVFSSGGAVGAAKETPILGAEEYGRIEGSGEIGMADAGTLLYQPWTLATPSGTRKFRLFRGASAYVLDPSPEGGPVDWSSGGLPDGADPVLKGAVLAGRAFLVRNYPEDAFAAPQTRSHGGELQMVVLTSAVLGHGPLCGHGYGLDGQISPTGYGEGYSAADRYRLEGKPLMSTVRSGPDPVPDELAPFPSVDQGEPSPC